MEECGARAEEDEGQTLRERLKRFYGWSLGTFPFSTHLCSSFLLWLILTMQSHNYCAYIALQVAEAVGNCCLIVIKQNRSFFSVKPSSPAEECRLFMLCTQVQEVRITQSSAAYVGGKLHICTVGEDGEALSSGSTIYYPHLLNGPYGALPFYSASSQTPQCQIATDTRRINGNAVNMHA